MAYLQQLLYNSPWLLLILANGVFLDLLFTRFVQVRSGKVWNAALLLVLAGSSGMVIWVGDNNLLMTLPVFFTLCLLCTQGDWVGRMAVTVIFFCLTMTVCALLDTYFAALDDHFITIRVVRTLVFGGLWLILRRRLPKSCMALSRRLWKLVLGLALMPLCALASTVLLGYYYTDYQTARSLTMSLGLAVLPFVLLTSVVLLFTITALSDYEQMERTSQLAGLREVYYQGLREQEGQVRQLRHDLRNHLTAIHGFLDAGEPEKALRYLDQIAGSPAVRGTRRICENETANIVLTAKAEAMAHAGIAPEFTVHLPEGLPIADTDLVALLGNALDNALEAAVQTEEKYVSIRCRADKGLFMLRAENSVAGSPDTALPTTKKDKQSHGFGIPGMREIASRYNGTLETTTKNDRFELMVCLSLSKDGLS